MLRAAVVQSARLGTGRPHHPLVPHLRFTQAVFSCLCWAITPALSVWRPAGTGAAATPPIACWRSAAAARPPRSTADSASCGCGSGCAGSVAASSAARSEESRAARARASTSAHRRRVRRWRCSLATRRGSLAAMAAWVRAGPSGCRRRRCLRHARQVVGGCWGGGWWRAVAPAWGRVAAQSVVWGCANDASLMAFPAQRSRLAATCRTQHPPTTGTQQPRTTRRARGPGGAAARPARRPAALGRRERLRPGRARRPPRPAGCGRVVDGWAGSEGWWQGAWRQRASEPPGRQTRAAR